MMRGGHQCAPAGISRCSFQPTRTRPLSNLNANHLNRAQAKCMTGIGGPACDDIGAGLQLVVDDNRARANQPALCGLGGEVRQRQRISAT